MTFMIRITVDEFRHILLERVAGFFPVLPANVYLRSADALHLAAAQIANAQAIYSSDRHLLSAASALGIVARNVI